MNPNERSKKPDKISPNLKSDFKLGSLLEKRRKELDLSYEKVEHDTHIRRKYLRLIEEGNYTDLSDDIYSRGHVKNYSDYLGFDSKEILKLYSNERREYELSTGLAKKSKNKSLKPIDTQVYAITPKTILLVLTSIFVMAMVVYVGWQFSQLSTPPSIRLQNQDKSYTDNSFVIISGEVDGGSDVYINDSPILSSADGSFSDRVMLVDGNNQIKVSAKNKFGKESTKTIIVDAKIGDVKNSDTKDVRKTTFDGVEVSVLAKNQAMYLVVKADGKDVYKGTMLPGSRQLFQAKDSIKLSTTNAGNTEISITNSLVSNKNLGTLGAEGDPKENIIINKDTNIQ